MKIHPEGAELFHVDRETDRQTDNKKDNNRFLQFYERA
jgi:hypothetical protein